MERPMYPWRRLRLSARNSDEGLDPQSSPEMRVAFCLRFGGISLRRWHKPPSYEGMGTR